jgi:hypothetical protein
MVNDYQIRQQRDATDTYLEQQNRIGLSGLELHCVRHYTVGLSDAQAALFVNELCSKFTDAQSVDRYVSVNFPERRRNQPI